MKKLFCLLVIAGLVSCAEEKISSNSCDSNEVSEGTPWFDSWIASMNCICEQTVYKGKYEGKTVFYTMITDARCCWIFGVTLYDCNGEEVKSYREDDSAEFNQEVILSEVVYRCRTVD